MLEISVGSQVTFGGNRDRSNSCLIAGPSQVDKYPVCAGFPDTMTSVNGLGFFKHQVSSQW